MYQALLTRRYLTHKIMPLLSAGAVMLCVLMVLVVWSVMGGFLDMLLRSGRTLMGDVSVTWPTVGFAHADDLIDRLERDPAVHAATPIIETFGIIHLPDGRASGVWISGIEPSSYSDVTGYASALWWKKLDEPLPRDTGRDDWRLGDPDDMPGFWDQVYRQGLSLTKPDPETGEPRPAAVLGIEVTDFNVREPGGWYTPGQWSIRTESGMRTASQGHFILAHSVTLSVLPLSQGGRAVDLVSRSFPVANELKTGVFEMDQRRVLVPLATLQQMLKMDAAERVETDPDHLAVVIDPETGAERFEPARVVARVPARVTGVLVRAVEGVAPERLKERVREVYAGFAADHRGEVPRSAGVQTWKENQATMVAAVEKETILVLFILGVISVVASALILAIFWSMVNEKTKDIGVLRALGASRAGIAWLWLRYGLVIGLIGSVLGVGLATLMVWYINPIHDWLGRALGVQVWNPEIYYFTLIPNEVDPRHALLVFGCGVFFSVAGALLPAVRAANMDPVRALRFE
ncbi:MAG TPA: FtsX-like permease family protein [Phycisphaerales bacterium]|nr:FtsX-like permease family protein [Phycisphaerales bacterium]